MAVMQLLYRCTASRVQAHALAMVEAPPTSLLLQAVSSCFFDVVWVRVCLCVCPCLGGMTDP